MTGLKTNLGPAVTTQYFTGQPKKTTQSTLACTDNHLFHMYTWIKQMRDQLAPQSAIPKTSECGSKKDPIMIQLKG